MKTPLCDGKGRTERVFWLDFMRAAAAIMVVLLHSGSPYLVRVGQPDAVQWAIIHSIEAAIQICVPVFFMISGALLVNADRDPLKSFTRALVPLVFYTLIAMAYLWFSKGTSPSETLWAAWTNKGFYHLWFFYPLIGIYACFHFLRASPTEPGRKAIALIAFMVVLGGGSGLIARSYSVGSRIFVDGMFFGFLLYAFLGFYLRKWLEETRETRWVVPGALLGFIAVWLVTIILSRSANEVGVRYSGLFFTYQSPNMVLQSVFAFILLKRAGDYVGQFARARTLISFVAALSLGLFGIHAFVMDALRFHTPLGLRSEHALAHFFGLFALTCIISLVVAFWISRVDSKRLLV